MPYLEVPNIVNMIRLKFSGLKMLAVLVGFALFSCEAIEDLIKFDYQEQIAFSVPPTTLGLVPVINTPQVDANSSSSFENNNTQAKYVKSAFLTDLTLKIDEPSDETFSFLNEIEIYIEAEGQERVLIASKYNIGPDVGSELVLDAESSTELKPYISGNSYTIDVKAKVDETTNKEIKITSDMTFRVTADVF
jgi:hypothetical protein